MSETLEIVQSIEQLSTALDELIMRGLKSAGREDLNKLTMLKEEFDRIGAHHLSGSINSIIERVRSNDSRSAAALLRTQASLRVFERILTLETVEDHFAVLGQGGGCSDDDEFCEDSDEDDDEENDDA